MFIEEYRTKIHRPMEDEANILLRNHGLLGIRGGLKTTRQLKRKTKADILQPIDPTEFRCGIDDDQILEKLYSELALRADLNPLYCEVFRLHLFGYTSREIAASLKIGRMKAIRIIKRSAVKLRKAYATDPYAGWYGIYISETQRR